LIEPPETGTATHMVAENAAPITMAFVTGSCFKNYFVLKMMWSLNNTKANVANISAAKILNAYE